MSATHYLYCPETKLYIEVGDWRDLRNPFGFQFTIPVGDVPTADKQIRDFERFLSMHHGKELRMLNFMGCAESMPEDCIKFTEAHWTAHVAQERAAEIKQWGQDPMWQDKWERDDYTFKHLTEGN